MNPYEFVLGIIIVLTVARLVTLSFKTKTAAQQDAPEADRLRGEVQMLRDRIAVLERITVEKENSLEREIEKLRDR